MINLKKQLIASAYTSRIIMLRRSHSKRTMCASAFKTAADLSNGEAPRRRKVDETTPSIRCDGDKEENQEVDTFFGGVEEQMLLLPLQEDGDWDIKKVDESSSFEDDIFLITSLVERQLCSLKQDIEHQSQRENQQRSTKEQELHESVLRLLGYISESQCFVAKEQLFRRCQFIRIIELLQNTGRSSIEMILHDFSEILLCKRDPLPRTISFTEERDCSLDKSCSHWYNNGLESTSKQSVDETRARLQRDGEHLLLQYQVNNFFYLEDEKLQKEQKERVSRLRKTKERKLREMRNRNDSIHLVVRQKRRCLTNDVVRLSLYMLQTRTNMSQFLQEEQLETIDGMFSQAKCNPEGVECVLESLVNFVSMGESRS